MYDSHYTLYKIYENEEWSLFVRSTRALLEGKLFSPRKVEEAGYMVVAVENGSDEELNIINYLAETGHQPEKVTIAELG